MDDRKIKKHDRREKTSRLFFMPPVLSQEVSSKPGVLILSHREGVAQMAKKQKKHKCSSCNSKNAKWVADPYIAEIEEKTEMRWLCKKCEEEIAEEI